MPREHLDTAAGASNGPALVADLRDLGLQLPCDRVPCVDRDGREVKRGVYHLTAYFSDRGRPNQSDRGRCFSVIVDGLGRRASPVLNVSQSSTISLKRSVEAPVLSPVLGVD